MANNLDLAISNLRDRDLIAQVTSSALNLDLLVQELLESRQIEDLVAYWLRAVDGVLSTCQRSTSPSGPQDCDMQLVVTYLLGDLSLLNFSSLCACGLY